VLSWFVRRLRSEAVVRHDVPVLADAASRRDYAIALGRILQQAWSSGVVDEFLAVAGAEIQGTGRPRFRLPRLDADTVDPA
jgi:hypothetical protein